VRNVSADPVRAGSLAGYTTLKLGGPPKRLLTAVNADEIVQSVRDTAAAGEPALVLGGGSNVVVADRGYSGTAILLRSRGIHPSAADGDSVLVRVEAGEPWDEVVAAAVGTGWTGLECLSGVPGSTGATPIQNVGAYGQEVAETITRVRVYDRRADRVRWMAPGECGFAYRTSVFKRSDRWVVLSVEFRLRRSAESAPVRYAELAAALGVRLGARAPLPVVREAVLGLRARKGMVLDPEDPDTYSVGSFFTNPVLGAEQAAGLGPAPSWPAGDGLVKVSAAWLIEQAGFVKGYARDGVAISAKHSLALTNRGSGTTAALLGLAAEIRDAVRARFGVILQPEPVLIDCDL
jgi:UDP-N-acetylmuramate dehydrogenase